MVPALPGLAGFDIPENAARGALALAAEGEETPWAQDTEAIIVAEISGVIDATMNLVAVECRTTWCGFIVDLPVGGDINIANEFGDRLGAVFSLNGRGTAIVLRPDGTRWIATYIEIRRLA